MKGLEGDEICSGKSEESVRVHLREADEDVDTGAAGIVADKTVGGGLHYGNFENKHGSFVKSYSHRVSKDDKNRRKAVGTVRKKVVFKEARMSC